MRIVDVEFEDNALRQCVLDKAIDAGLTYTGELNNIICNSLGITSLKGMGEFTNVVALTFNDNLIDNLGPLRNLLELRGLTINNNKIKDFYALDHLGELRLIEAQNNVELKNIYTIVYMGNLKFLDLRGSGTGNKISCADLDKLNTDINSRQIGNLAIPPEFFPPETCTGASSTGLNTAARADMNNDGLSDLLLEFDPANASEPYTWKIATAYADGFSERFDQQSTFTPVKGSAVSSNTAIAIADANGDGTEDLLTQVDYVDGGRGWKVYLSNGTGLSLFSTFSLLGADAGDDARAVAFNDANGDGYADVLIQAQGVTDKGVVGYYMAYGTGAGYLAPVRFYQFGQELGRPQIIALEDVNNDGTADIVFERRLGNKRCFFVRTHNGIEFERQPSSRQCLALTLPVEKDLQVHGVADVTGNGMSELIISYVSAGRTQWYSYTLQQGVSGTEWSTMRLISTALTSEGTQKTVAIADLNKDGRADILSEVIQGTQKFWKAHITADYYTSEVQLWLTGNADSISYRTIGLEDYDGDGDPDLLIDMPSNSVDQQLFVKINDGNKFESDGLNIWSASSSSPSIVGTERDGLTRFYNDNGALISRVGSLIKYTPNELSDELASVGLVLTQPVENSNQPAPALKKDECRIIYDEGKEDPLAVGTKYSWGAVVCSMKIGDHVTIQSSILYGECSIKDNGTGLLSCKAGLFKDEVKIEIAPGVETEVAVEGPNAKFCAGIVRTGACAGVGADVVSGSGKFKAGRSSAGLGAGIGFGAEAGASLEDGVFAGNLGGKFIGGFSVEIAVDLKPIYRVSEEAYLFVEDTGEVVVLAAGEGIFDAVNLTGEVSEVIGEEVIYITERGADAAVAVVTVVGDSLVDSIGTIESGLEDAGGAVVGVISGVGSGIGSGVVSIVKDVCFFC